MSESRSAVEREIANIRCMVAQQIVALDRSRGRESRAADALLRELLRRDEELRRTMAPAIGHDSGAVPSD